VGRYPLQPNLHWHYLARRAADNAAALGWRLTADEVAALDQASDAIR
jgi:hypothetical protein